MAKQVRTARSKHKGGKGGKLSKKSNLRKGLIVGAVLGGLYLLYRSSGAAAAGPALAMQSIAVKGGQAATAESYRVIASRRSGMDYMPASGQPGGKIEFTPSRDGIFTRNAVLENNALLVEIK